MSELLDLLRPDLRGFAGYSSARRSATMPATVWLNANENPWPNPADSDAHCRRYPEPQPQALRAALAELYGVSVGQLLIGRGSDEAIDLLVRALCRPGVDAVIATPPVFGMYAVCARLQNAPLIEVPLRDGEAGFSTDMAAIADAALHGNARLVFLCSPANPTGQGLAFDAIATLANALRGQALVVVDEAYGEFSAQASATTLLAEHGNIAVLRTLSKAHALAAARVGTLIADPALIAMLRNCQAPYPLPTPCVELALAALAPEALAITRARVALVISERERLLAALPGCAGVRRVYPSQGNYLLLRFVDAEAAFARLLAAGIMVRDMRAQPQLGDALRISIGSAAENDLVLAALGTSIRTAGVSA
ncbi:MAG: histidinol-phosphate transaminase [Xanthomonadaceae bacterium]|nr:histidinol-phosphate transaminase [Xanthomonadaceae bacterium]MDP2184404.1 histidinol-phosphate transaminase [Xanthomonadales bacterium]MDZ4116803.1 histidinol-phosphate transaminase [Xanthomonadaceae bacterium]MDZ4377804.1 histidinol-phosphate transaminase [Xanthomonadaceae bacterium]